MDKDRMMQVLESINKKNFLHGEFSVSADMVSSYPQSLLKEHILGVIKMISVNYSRIIVPYHTHKCKDGSMSIFWIHNTDLTEEEAALMVAIAINKCKDR